MKTTPDWTRATDRKFAVNSVCRSEAISLIQTINQCSESNAVHYVDSLVKECQQEAIKRGLITHKVFLVRDDMNQQDLYIDTCFYIWPR
ncbi:hypothetical protein D3C71_1680110 [compost metagenome]